MKNVEVLKETQDDWYGAFILKGFYQGRKDPLFVKVRYCGNIVEYDTSRAPIWRTCVWGSDDFGLEFDCDSEKVAWDMFLQVIGMKFVNQQSLRDLGFISA